MICRPNQPVTAALDQREGSRDRAAFDLFVELRTLQTEILRPVFTPDNFIRIEIKDEIVERWSAIVADDVELGRVHDLLRPVFLGSSIRRTRWIEKSETPVKPRRFHFVQI